ncbi:MAG: co-chaperone GroES [Candidatus Vogelbacteria bacterium CG10_big_fil_rev_8_21_14_0_10_45_14]|uniref:Co-chaperonin GroES n=1 Tax=Candidatus Vogelbacteria bacterium CG10_big_fil_rev_8_21_14_0_10_45_14 TaxID=1975042 RepID=A0A2H0RJA4_9BACT|nr:MAG: co-chaperone GroES [Candidatus Vogelbacteria bacterium CG10_big_fil_rev_8_21_14_0_10_45_14]
MAKKLNVVPLADRVIVEPLSELERGAKTKSGIFIPETADKERPEQGVVVAVGPGKRTDEGVVYPVGVKVGDKIMFTKYGPDEIKIEGKEYFILSESNILAIIND